MWKKLLDLMLSRIVREGALQVTWPDGSTTRYGETGVRPVGISVSDMATVRAIALNPDLGVGEGYVSGTLKIEDDDLHGFLDLALRNVSRQNSSWQSWQLNRLRTIGRRLWQRNAGEKAQRNVAHHYDLSAELYGLFLDEDRQYSCGYFRSPDASLDEAQRAKKALIARKLLIEPGMRVLDIGCGWGGLALTLARDYGAEVVGITLSREQHRYAEARARAEGLTDLVSFRLMDYREVEDRFDRIVSVGMFEHVGVPHYPEYFRTIRTCLKEDGIALVHTIGRSTPPGTTSPWIRKYIFPGGYIPALSEMMAAVEREGLCLSDAEVWRLHYAETLRHWYDRFVVRIDEARRLYDDEFCRVWRYYLKASEMSFRHGHQVVFQAQLAIRNDAVPITRDYLYGDKDADAMIRRVDHAAVVSRAIRHRDPGLSERM